MKVVKKMNTKDLCAHADEIVKNRVTSFEKFQNALATLKQLESQVEYFKGLCKELNAHIANISEECAYYGTKHPKCFGDTAIFDDNGNLKSGDILVEECDCIAHYLLSLDKFKRVDGGLMTQEFLEGLPKGWTKRNLTIATNSIKDLLEKGKITADDIAAQKLERKDKHEWSWKVSVSAEAAESGQV